MRSISWDLETFSSVDLAKCGVYKYAESPDFEILLFGCFCQAKNGPGDINEKWSTYCAVVVLKYDIV
jgi:hypothetical protein